MTGASKNTVVKLLVELGEAVLTLSGRDDSRAFVYGHRWRLRESAFDDALAVRCTLLLEGWREVPARHTCDTRVKRKER
jgi:hypothetical protein